MDPSVLRAFRPSIHSHRNHSQLPSVDCKQRFQYTVRSLVWPLPRWSGLSSLDAIKRSKGLTRMTLAKSRHLRSDSSRSEGTACDHINGRTTREPEKKIESTNGAVQVNGPRLHGAFSESRISTRSVESAEAVSSIGATEPATPLQAAISNTPTAAAEHPNRRLTQRNHGLLAQAVAAKEKSAILNSGMELLQSFFRPKSAQEVTLITQTGDRNPGLGISQFLKGKNIFITGATGFLAKVLVEKILRVQPDVEQLFLLIKANDLHSAKRRLKTEIVDASLFKILQRRYGSSYEDFMARKLTPVVGNITLDGLGLDQTARSNLSTKLHIVVNSAATTTFDARYDHALNLNTKGAQRILEFSKECPHLQLVMHVSTAYVNGQRRGLVHEQAFRMGHSIAKELGKEGVPDLDVETELNLIERKIDEVLAQGQNTGSCSSEDGFDMTDPNGFKDKLLSKAMKELGLERANLFGWQDTYVFTKAMGEMLIHTMREQLPVVIIRPSVIESSIKEPFAGWMEGNRMMDPIILSYGKGQLNGFLVDPMGVLDVVPVDMVANAMLAAMAKHSSKSRLEVYQIASSISNPLIFGELSRLMYEHFKQYPYVDNGGNIVKPKRLHLYQDMETFMASLYHVSEQKLTNKQTPHQNSCTRQNNLIVKAREQASYLASLYRAYTFYMGRFDNSNTKQLYGELSYLEKDTFGFNVQSIDWEHYIKEIHIPGLRKHVLKGRGSNVEF